MRIPSFTAEQSLVDRIVAFRLHPRPSDTTQAAGAIRPALTVGEGGVGDRCGENRENCVDCGDDVQNIVCRECGQGGDLHCCSDPTQCLVFDPLTPPPPPGCFRFGNRWICLPRIVGSRPPSRTAGPR